MFRITARTVLELGSELISSDIIAFYELIKNAFDAGSKTGVDVSWRVVLRRNAYLKIRAQAVESAAGGRKQGIQTSLLQELKIQVEQQCDPTAGPDAIESFFSRISPASTLDEFVKNLDQAYVDLNMIEIADTGSGMSAKELTKNYLTIGTASRKREILGTIAKGGSRTPFLGEKGIGRLSAMRLGDRLYVETARAEDKYMNVLDLDWSRFADLDAMVEDILVEPEQGEKKKLPSWSGTRLTIANLTEDWTEKRVRQLAEYEFARLTDPFLDPKDRSRIALYWNGNRVAIPWMDRTLTDNAHATFEGEYLIDAAGPQLKVRMEPLLHLYGACRCRAGGMIATAERNQAGVFYQDSLANADNREFLRCNEVINRPQAKAKHRCGLFL